MLFMKRVQLVVVLSALVLALVLGGCGGGEGGESGGEGGEESGMALALDEMYDHVRGGARLILEAEAAFVGTVENTTAGTLQNVRVEVHLSNDIELGPVVIGDLASGEIRDVEVVAMRDDLTAPFTGWTPHAEVGAGGESGVEHGPGGEGGGESGGGRDEEPTMALALDEMYDHVRGGARLILEAEVAFVGTVENTTAGTLRNVRVEVHLPNGIELGPVVIGDLAPGEIIDVEVIAMRDDLMAPFTGWTPHAEVGAGGDSGGEHGPGGEGGSSG